MNKDLLWYNKNDVLLIGKQENNISFEVKELSEPILELKQNGDILVKGKLIENDIEVVDALREFITYTNRRRIFCEGDENGK